jgi:hypothetical protein
VIATAVATADNVDAALGGIVALLVIVVLGTAAVLLAVLHRALVDYIGGLRGRHGVKIAIADVDHRRAGRNIPIRTRRP